MPLSCLPEPERSWAREDHAGPAAEGQPVEGANGVRVCLQVQGPLREYPQTGRLRLQYYCIPLVCVPDVIGGLAVWRHNNNKNEREDTEVI